MEDIWKSLIGVNEREVLEEWFETIIEDLLAQALGREWRTRESSCNAIGELVQGRGVEKVCFLFLLGFKATTVIMMAVPWCFCWLFLMDTNEVQGSESVGRTVIVNFLWNHLKLLDGCLL